MPLSRPQIFLPLLAACVAALAGGCTSRTLPLPPPAVDPIGAAPDEDGMVTVTGISQEGASVGVLNDATLTGVIVTTGEFGCGRSCPFEARVPAEAGDSIRVWQFFETGDSDELIVPEP